MRTVQIDGDAVLLGRAMDPRFDRVLRAVNQFAYVVVNPANGPEAVDGLDLDADGYAGPNPNVEDFVLRAKRLGAGSGTKVLGYLPKSRGDAAAVDYRARVGTDGVFLAGYTCPEATSAVATISGAWPGAVIVIGTTGCTGGAAAVNTADPAQYVLADPTASNVPSGSLDPYAGYPVAPAPKLGVPAYFADLAAWDRLLAGIADIGVIAIEPSNLPVIRSKVRAARAGGAKIYAYVPTGYLTKDPTNASLASSRIATAVADPDVDGVFLDEVRSGCSVKAQNDYTAMYNQVIAAGKRLVYNPGQTAGSCFTAISNTSVNFEGSAASYPGWPASEWGRTVGQDSIWQIVHSASIGDIPSLVALAKQRNAGLIWVAQTDQWTQFPDAAYFDAMRSAVRGSLTPPGPTSPTTSTIPTSGTTPPAGLSNATPVTIVPLTPGAPSTTVDPATLTSTSTTSTTSTTSSTVPPGGAVVPPTTATRPSSSSMLGEQAFGIDTIGIPFATRAAARIVDNVSFTG